jgi:hypothetical protein
MKKRICFLLLVLAGWSAGFAQSTDNAVSATVDGKAWSAKAQKLNLSFPKHVKYFGLAGMAVNPDVQLWIRFLYTGEKLKPGTYEVIPQEDDAYRKIYNQSAGGDVTWALVDYTEETKGAGHAFRDGESWKGTVTITKVTDTSIEGTFEATLKGVLYKKRGFATATGAGLFSNLEDKMITKAGGGMLVKGDPHDHDNCKKNGTTDDIVVNGGKFSLTWESKK